MAGFRVISEKKNEIVYSCGALSDLCGSSLGSLIEDSAVWHVFRPKEISCASVRPAREAIPDVYFSQLGFIADGAQLYDPARARGDEALVDAHETEGEAARFREVFRAAFLEPWRDYLGGGLELVFREAFTHALRTGRSFSYSIDDAEAGQLLVYDDADCLGRKVMQIGWVWVSPELDAAQRSSVHHRIFGRIRDMKAPLYQAGVHLHNVRSHSFFRRLGFRPVCIHIKKKS